MSSINLPNLFLSYQGKIGRKEFWIGIVSIVAVSLFLQTVIYSAVNYSDAQLVALLSTVIFVYPGFAIYVKRCRDRGLSLWWLLMIIVPIVGLIWVVLNLGMRQGIADMSTVDTAAA